jgi:chemotaxis signal transduction protein
VSPSPLDWAATRARLESAAATAAGGPALPPEKAQRVLEERARLLAEPPKAVSLPGETLDLLVFRRADAAYGVDATRVVEVVGRLRPTTLPGFRPFLPGVIHHRGRIVAVLDVRGLIAPGAPPAEEGRMVVVAAGPTRLALFADEIQGVSTISADEVAVHSGAPAAWVRGTTAGMVSVLDIEGLAGDPRLRVDEAGT